MDTKWAVKWRSTGDTHLVHRNCMPVLFRTRDEARQWIETEFHWIKGRKDLREAPFSWKMPIPVRIKIVEV